MKCIRCSRDSVRTVAEAPDGSKAWEVYACSACNFSWRNSEEDAVINSEKRDPYFQLGNVDLEALIAPVPIPPLKK